MDWPPDGDETKYGPWLALSDGAEIQSAGVLVAVHIDLYVVVSAKDVGA